MIATPQAAHAAVAAGDEVFASYSDYQIYLRSGSTETNLSNNSYSETQPDVSPDGSKIAFISYRPLPGTSTNAYQLYVMNSDGSAQTQLDVYESYFVPSLPRWSPDNETVAFTRYNSNTGDINVFTIKLGESRTQLTTNNTSQGPVAWSLTKTSGKYRIVYNNTYGRYSFSVMDEDGGNKRTLVDSTHTYSGQQGNPDWSPDGSRIYYQSNYGGGYGAIRYYASTDGFATDSNVTDNGLTSVSGDSDPRVSADGSTVQFIGGYDRVSAYYRIFSISSGGGSATELTTGGNPPARQELSLVKASWPEGALVGDVVTISAPSSSNALYTRQISIDLSTTGVEKFQYGWSTSDTTAPDTSYLQESTNLSTKQDAVNYLGKYVSSAWHGGTQPNADWYLWVRTVQTGGTPNSWNGGGSNKPLKVHTPKKPRWVGTGDSFSSGHNQLNDERYCPKSSDASFYPGNPACAISGAPHLTENDSTFSWVHGAVTQVNSSLHVPTEWAMEELIYATSGVATSSFGATGHTVGSSAWAADGTQAGKVRSALYQRANSWNVVSMTGGANDTNWQDVLKDWYTGHFSSSYEPWSVPTGNNSNCPDTESVYQTLHSNSLLANITTNLQGIVTVAANASPGARVLNVGYPYVVDTGTQTTGNPCYADWWDGANTHHGVKSVMDDLNDAHTDVTGARVKYVDIEAAFSDHTVASGYYISTNRLYGYPHPIENGQSKMADAAVTVLTGSGW